MERWSGRVALVTGASVGIGAAICRRLVDAGMTVIGAARGVEKIQALANELKSKPGKLVAVKCDLTKDEDIMNMFAFIKKNHKGVDVCINNAGMSHGSSLLEGTPDQWRNMVDINVIGLCLCTKEAFKSMRERNVDDGHIIHVSSLGGHNVIDIPPAHFYMSTKFAVRALTEGHRQEIRNLKSNIRVSSISPGAVATEFAQRALGEDIAKEVMKMQALKADDIAASICYMLSAPPTVQVHDILIRPTCDGH